jgi:hypothetical protein
VVIALAEQVDRFYFSHNVSNLQGKFRLRYNMVFYIVLFPSFLGLDMDTDSFLHMMPEETLSIKIDISSVDS